MEDRTPLFEGGFGVLDRAVESFETDLETFFLMRSSCEEFIGARCFDLGRRATVAVSAFCFANLGERLREFGRSASFVLHGGSELSGKAAVSGLSALQSILCAPPLGVYAGAMRSCFLAVEKLGTGFGDLA